MKLTLAIPVLAALLTTTGCTTLLTTTAFVSDEEATIDRTLTGIWTNDDDTLIIRQKDKGYEVFYVDGSKTYTYQALLLDLGDAKLLDLTPQNDDPFVLPLHAVVRVWPEANTLRWTFVDSDWAKEQAVRTAPTQRSGDRTIVTGDARGLARRLGSDSRALGKVDVWTRVQ